jgi:hypothetical protein
LLSFGAEFFVFQFAILKYEVNGIWNYNCSFSLYGCEIWPLISKGERRLRVFENKALRRIFGPKRDEVTG